MSHSYHIFIQPRVEGTNLRPSVNDDKFLEIAIYENVGKKDSLK